jgi:hypothetical protein
MLKRTENQKPIRNRTHISRLPSGIPAAGSRYQATTSERIKLQMRCSYSHLHCAQIHETVMVPCNHESEAFN